MERKWYDTILRNHFNGQDEIRFTMNDGDLTSKEATIIINLKPENDAPVAEELVFQTQQDQTVVITLEAVDVDGDNATFDLETLPSMVFSQWLIQAHGITHPMSNSPEQTLYSTVQMIPKYKATWPKFQSM